MGGFAEVAAVGLLAVHHEDGGAYLVDIVEETAVGVGLCADDAPAVTMHWSMMLPPSSTREEVVQSPLIRAEGNFVIFAILL